MQIEEGSIVEGKVTSITNFGAFLDLGDGKSGMVHISEVANTYVKEISEYLSIGDEVKAKVLTINPEGKISLSIKKLEDGGGLKKKETSGVAAAPPKKREPRRTAAHYPPIRQEDSGPQTFEDMMSKFKNSSDDRMSDIRRNTENKRGAHGGSKRNSRGRP